MIKFHCTNNFCVSWNSCFNKLVGTTNPSFWTVLRAIQLDECGNRLHKKQKSKKNYRENKLLHLCNQHAEHKITNYEFLYSISNICKFF